MKKKISLFISLTLLVCSLAGCGNDVEDTAPNQSAAEDTQPEFTFEQCGLSYSLPPAWYATSNTNLIPTSYADLSGDIYAKIQYNYAPDENFEELNNPDSQVPVDSLLAPLVTLLVVREDNADSHTVLDELDAYDTYEELPGQDGFLFYMLTHHSNGIRHLSSSAQKTFRTLEESLDEFRASIETFQPNEEMLYNQLDADKNYLNFISVTMEGDSISSTVFYDYDMTVVNFWASYCYPDINELETLEALYQELQMWYPNVNFIQVIIDTPDANAQDIVTTAYHEASVTFTGVMTDQALAGWVIDNIRGLPTTAFVDHTGKLLNTRIEGVQDLEMYIDQIDFLLKTLGKQ